MIWKVFLQSLQKRSRLYWIPWFCFFATSLLFYTINSLAVCWTEKAF